MQVGHAEDGSLLPINLGRPNLRSILAKAVAENCDLASVGIFGAGPQTMVREVRTCCAESNDNWKNPFLDFSSHSFDL